MQASLDIQSGIMHAQEQDFKTAYSYFYEAFEGFDSTSSEKNAVAGLKYMLLCKIMLEKAEDVPSILSSKLALKYSSGDLAKELEAMKAVAKSNQDRSLEAFEKALQDYKEELAEDVIIQSHVSEMYDTMLQNNLCRIVEAYSSIEVRVLRHAVGGAGDGVGHRVCVPRAGPFALPKAAAACALNNCSVFAGPCVAADHASGQAHQPAAGRRRVTTVEDDSGQKAEWYP